MRRLGGGVDNYARLDRLDERQHASAVANIELMVDETLEVLDEPVLIPAGVTLRTEEDRALVVIDAMNRVALSGEINANFRANKTRGTGY